MTKTTYFSNHFLIAMPSLKDPNFSRSVILLCEHDKEGAMGIIINKPLHVTLSSVLEHLNLIPATSKIGSTPVFMGGPVGQEHGFVLHEPYDNNNKSKGKLNTPVTNDDLVISASKETLADIACGKGPKRFHVALGYAGWEADQLLNEINRNDWLVTPYDKELIFNTPVEARWEKAVKLLGVDFNNLSSQVGHA